MSRRSSRRQRGQLPFPPSFPFLKLTFSQYLNTVASLDSRLSTPRRHQRTSTVSLNVRSDLSLSSLLPGPFLSSSSLISTFLSHSALAPLLASLAPSKKFTHLIGAHSAVGKDTFPRVSALSVPPPSDPPPSALRPILRSCSDLPSPPLLSGWTLP